MTHQEIKALQSLRSYPSVTITMPTHRLPPENRQDPILLKNLVAEAAARLCAEFPKREVQDILETLERLAKAVDFRHARDGLAIFVSREVAKVFSLPFRVRARTVVDETFATRDLVFGLHRSQRYRVLALSEKPTRLFEGSQDVLTEISGGGFPMVHEGPGGTEPLPPEWGLDKSAYRDERHRQFFRRVDSALRPFMVEDPLPLVVVGVEKYLAFFREVTDHASHVVATVPGNYDKASAHALGKVVWPHVEHYLAQQRAEALMRLEKAVSAGTYVCGIEGAWRLAREGRGDHLLVEQSFYFPAVLTPDGGIAPAPDPSAPGVVDDAVDELIETVLAKKGKVSFMADGQLERFSRIALILRY